MLFSLPKKTWLLAGWLVFNAWAASWAQSPASLHILNKPARGAFPLFAKGQAATVITDPADAEVVRIAATAFQQDVAAVTGVRPALATTGAQPSGYVVLAGTLGQSALIDQLAGSQRFPAGRIRGKWETFSISVVENPLPGVPQALVVAGSDRRGTAYGLFELSRQMGVAPYSWWADITPRRQRAVYVPAGTCVEGPPAVKFRGIFLNDEDWGLQPWAARNVDTDVKDIGPKTYAKVFELLLRLKGNYLWPAMHPSTKAFWYYKDNPKVAEQYAIVLGASHCEPILRNNIFEWTENYEHEYSQKPGPWRYDTNRDQIKQYWNDRARESKANDAVYTVGMRGIHDSNMPGPTSPPEKVRLLEEVLRDQRALLSANLGKPAEQVPQLFCPYKEVLGLYQAGMQLPDDITIAWADDNYGYIRQLSTPAEQQRSGGSGVYYHLSYWGWPSDYLWLSTISPALTSFEMTKALRCGADRLWVVNVGDIKPAELETQFFMDLAWQPARWSPERAQGYVQQWAAETFGPRLAAPIAQIKNAYYHLASAGKPEQLDQVTFTPAALEQRLADYRALDAQATALAKKVPADLHDAYFELVLYPVQASRLMNEKILYARESLRLAGLHDPKALDYARRAQAAFAQIKPLTDYYNTGIAGGKWNGMMDWRPRGIKVFDMPPVATEAMLRTAPNPEAAPAALVAAPLILPAAQFSRKSETGEGRFQALPGLGVSDTGLAILPLLMKSYAATEVASAPHVDYEIPLTPGSKRVTVKWLPTFRLYDGLALRYAISVNGDAPQVQSVGTLAETKPWAINVVHGYAASTTRHEVKDAKKATIRVYFLDPGLVLSQVEVSGQAEN